MSDTAHHVPARALQSLCERTLTQRSSTVGLRMAWPTQGVCHLATLDGFATDLADSEWKALTSQEACERLLAATEPASDAAGDHLCEAVAGVAQHLQKTPADSALLGAATAALQRGLEFLRTSAHQAGDQDVRVCALAFLALQVSPCPCPRRVITRQVL